MIENPRTCELGKGRTGILIFYSFRAGLLAFVFLVLLVHVNGNYDFYFFFFFLKCCKLHLYPTISVF